MSETNETKTPEPPAHARDDAESVEQVGSTPATSGNATDVTDAPAVAGLTLYGAQVPVELRYDKLGPEVTVTVGDTRHQVANLHRFQLTHDAKDALPRLALWTYPLDGARMLALEAADVYDVRALERGVQRAVLHAASAREYGRKLAIATARCVADEYGPPNRPGYKHLLRFVEQAHSALLSESPADAVSPTLGDAITRAWLLAEDAQRMAASAETELHTGDAVTLLRELAVATRVVTERLAAMTVHGAKDRGTDV